MDLVRYMSDNDGLKQMCASLPTSFVLVLHILCPSPFLQSVVELKNLETLCQLREANEGLDPPCFDFRNTCTINMEMRLLELSKRSPSKCTHAERTADERNRK